jgi:hypothetical protein
VVPGWREFGCDAPGACAGHGAGDDAREVLKIGVDEREPARDGGEVGGLEAAAARGVLVALRGVLGGVLLLLLGYRGIDRALLVGGAGGVGA